MTTLPSPNFMPDESEKYPHTAEQESDMEFGPLTKKAIAEGLAQLKDKERQYPSTDAMWEDLGI